MEDVRVDGGGSRVDLGMPRHSNDISGLVFSSLRIE